MAQMTLAIAGSAVGGYFGGPIGGMIGAQLGSMAGALIDQAIFGSSAQKVKGPRVNDLLVQNASYGQPIARCWGQVAIAGNLIWLRPLRSRCLRGANRAVRAHLGRRQVDPRRRWCRQVRRLHDVLYRNGVAGA